MDCCCLEIQVVIASTGETRIFPLTIEPTTFNGKCVYSFTDGVLDYYWWFTGGEWYLTRAIGDSTTLIASWKETVDCPATEGDPEPVATYGIFFSSVLTRECVDLCDCILLGIVQEENPPFSENLSSTGTYNNRPVWTFTYFGTIYTLYYNGVNWIIVQGGIGGPARAFLFETDPCPVGFDSWISKIWDSIGVELGECECVPTEERIFKEYQSIKLPEIFEEEDRGFFKCCEPQLVLADPFSSDTWKNDVTSAWIKLSDPSDTATILLTKDGQNTSYPIQINNFPNEPYAIYRTINWKDVLTTDGIGCYKIEISFVIGGMTGSFTWGVYDLRTYSIQNALKTARIRVKLNLKQQIEGINFTDSNVEDSIRFFGFIGERQSNMEIDNLIYQNRVVRSVVRENLDTYEIKTDPYTAETLRRLTDLYLLSENEMYISDYNAHNNDYRIQDVPVITQDSPEIDYLDKYQRKAVLTCIVGLKTKNKRTFY